MVSRKVDLVHGVDDNIEVSTGNQQNFSGNLIYVPAGSRKLWVTDVPASSYTLYTTVYQGVVFLPNLQYIFF